MFPRLACVLIAGILWRLVALGDPVMALRLRGPHTATPEQWSKTLQAIKANPGCCDEVWFSTGIGVPPLAWHRAQAERIARAAADLRILGIVPSLQFQATLGHSDSLSSCEDCSAKTWTGWTGSTGVEDKYCNCPRQPAFLTYLREMAGIYAAFEPGSVWIDDDLRLVNHLPATKDSESGCWCATCLSAFNAETGGTWTRTDLAAAVTRDAALKQRWQAFSIRAITHVARVIASEFQRLSPGTRMGLQHTFEEASLPVVRALRDALYEASGKPIGLRPGGGFYYDLNPSDQILKVFLTAASQEKLQGPQVAVWCPEVESWPRAYGSRCGQSALIESFMALAYGCTSTSLLLLDTRYETDDVYSRTILKTLAAGAPALTRYAEATRDTIPVGYVAPSLAARQLYRWALCGIPVLPGIGKSLGTLSRQDLALDICQVGSATVDAARCAHASPVRIVSPFVGLMVPRADAAGNVKTVALLNTRIEAQGPVILELAGAKPITACWQELRGKAIPLSVVSSNSGCCVTIPEIGPWNAGFVRVMPAIPSGRRR